MAAPARSKLIALTRDLLRDSSSRAWTIMTAASMARLAVGFVASVLIARALGPADLGIYATLAAVASIVGAFSEFGLTESAVRRIASLWPSETEKAGEVAASYVWARLGLTTLIVASLSAAIGVGALIDVTPWRPLLLLLALLGVLATGLSGAVSGLLQSTERFGRLASVMLANSVLTALLALALYVTGRLTLVTALVVLGVGTSLTCFGIGYRQLPRSLGLRAPVRSVFVAEARRLLRFGRWLWVANWLAMLAIQADLILAGHWLSPVRLGAYALAVSLSSKAGIVNQSLHAALLPAAASLSSPDEIRSFLRRGIARSLIVLVCLLLMAPLARPLIPAIFGSGYRSATGIFLALLAVAALDLLFAPILMLAYTAGRSGLIAAADASRVLTLLAVALVLLPTVGVYGLVVAKGVASVSGLVVTVVVLREKMRSDGVSVRALVASNGVEIQPE
ncbi:MAG: oligosaccharide flippase family protein [Nitrolancea sp.]